MAGPQSRSEATNFFGELLGQDVSSSLKNPLAGCSKTLRGEAREDRSFDSAQDRLGGDVLLLYVDGKSVERNEAYESFSATC
jgi:hypothetical protein